MDRNTIAVKVSYLCKEFSDNDFATISLSLLGMIKPFAGIAQSVSRIISRKILDGLDGSVLHSYVNERIKGIIEKCIQKSIQMLPKRSIIREEYIKEIAHEWTKYTITENGDFEILKNNNQIISNMTAYNTLLDDREKKRLKECFHGLLELYLFANEDLNAYIANRRVGNVETMLNDLMNNTNKVYRRLYSQLSSLHRIQANNLIQKIGLHRNEDGMIRYLSMMFEKMTDGTKKIMEQCSTDTLSYLSAFQDAYNEAFALFNQGRREIALVGDELSRIIDLQKTAQLYNENEDNLYIKLYVDFMCADIFYFQDDYDSAIVKYSLVEGYLVKLNNNSSLSQIIQDALLYIYNSIGWSFHKLGQDKKSLLYYKKIGNAIAEGNYSEEIRSFLSRYLRNSGVCYEKLGKSEEAVRQYKKAIEILPEHTLEFKAYITYCSCIMKDWDRVYQKVTLMWYDNVRQATITNGIEPISGRIIRQIKSYLDMAKTMNSRFSDIYVQIVKILVYELMYDPNIDKERQCYIIEENILTAQDLSDGLLGYRFVIRDYYYALYLMNYQSQKNNWINRARIENNRLYESLLNAKRGPGDTQYFEELFNNL